MTRQALTLLLTSFFLPDLPALAEDLVTLKNGDHFVGEISGLSEGFIEIASPHSEAPLSILSGELHELSFAQTEAEAEDIPGHQQVINLRNGDSLPGEVIALDDKNLKFKTWFAGDLSIPRTQIDSIFYETAPQRLIYQGPKVLSNWKQDDNWGFTENAFRSNGRGSLSKDLKLPEDFIYRFQLEWKSTPNLRIHFCTSAELGQENKDGYYLSFISQGFQIQRVLKNEDNDTTRFLNLGRPNFPLDQITNRTATIEMRVSRSTHTIYLYVNQNFAGEFTDPSEPPEGTGVIFESQSSSRRQYTIQGIKVHEWDSKTRNLNREKHEKKSTDTVATDEGDLYTGKIRKRVIVDEKPIYEVKIDLADQPVPIPENRCSALYFKKEELSKIPASAYLLELVGGGSLSISGITLGENDLTAEHPWLGELKLDRRVLGELLRQKKGDAK